MPLTIRRHLFILFLALLATLSLVSPCRALTNRIAVFYPQVEEPYLSVFQTIVRGIESSVGEAVRPYAVAEPFDVEKLSAWVSSEQPDSIIALGRQGYLAAIAAAGSVPVLFGALPNAPDGLPGISLSPEPDVLFRTLKDISSRIERVHVVYSSSNVWLIKLAEEAARSRGLKLSAHKAEDLREAVRTYRDLLQSMRQGTEAIWLPLDNVTANDEVVLPMVLQAAWDRGMIVFSSKPSHAQRGALFSMFPDHFALGKRLGKMALRLHRSSEHPEVFPLADLQVAVNLRTAAHLGLRFTPQQQDRFDLVFPSR